MAATDGQIILAASRFGDTTPVYLRDFSKQQLPAVAKIIKGHHQNLGVPTLSAPSLQSTALFLSAGKKYQILAQPIKIKEGRKSSNVGCKVLIPETYPGYFELLSEDGRSTRCIDSVLELSKRRNTKVLVRETFRCTQINRTIQAGEMLTTVNENGKYLQCKNIQDEIINLPLETKAKFSQIAKEDSISGVHSVKNLLLKRMPVIVRLVHGSAPKGLKQPFVPELRLLGCVESDRIFALPLQKDTDLISVPLNAKIKLQRAKNTEQLQHFIEYSRFLEKAQRLLADERDRLQVIDMKFSEKEKKDTKFHNRNKLSLVLLPSTGAATGVTCSSGVFENGYVLRKSASCDSYSKSSQQLQQSSQIADEYNEIDHIYDYVRGLTPLSKSLTRFEPICESPTLKSQTTTDSSNSNYCSLIRLTSTINCNGTIINNNNNNNNINNNFNANSGYTYNNNHSSLESSKQTVGSHHSGTNPNHSQNNHNSLVQQQHHHHNLHQHAYCQNQPQTPIQNTHLPTSILANATGASGTSKTPITPTIHHYNHSNIQEDIKPLPPPIETIPGKKLPEKRQRPTLPKLYVKNNNNSGLNLNNNGNITVSKNQNYHSHHHYHNQTSKTVSPANQSLNPNNNSSPLGAAIPNIGTVKDSELEPQSPLFHIRYKSLSNLQLTPDVSGTPTPISVSTAKGQPDIKIKCHNNSNNKNNSATYDNTNNNNQFQQQSKCPSATGAREGTLESSRSGGRTSGESKLPEKKTRRLSRPRSLSNLVWDLKPSKEKSKKKLYIHHFDHRQQSTLYL